MRQLLVISVVALSSVAPAVAFACGHEGAQRPVDPSLFVAEQSANELIARAERIEHVAHATAERARHAERRAAALTAQARELRQVAVEIDGSERSNLIIAAGELGLRAAQEQRRAQRASAQARSLRAQAQQLRERAARLTAVQQIQQRRDRRPRSRQLI